MYAKKKILALITARSGSKGVPNKNIKLLAGKPLVYWTIKEALKSRFIDDLIVSTDSQKIADICVKYGATAPFLRPKVLAKDNSTSMDAVRHAVNFLKTKGSYYEIILLLQPTSPLRKSSDIDNSIKLLIKNKAKAVISVTNAFIPPLWVNTLPKNGCMKNFLNKRFKNKNRQNLPEFYQLNGAIYAGFIDYILKDNSFFGNKTFSYLMPRERSIDIDNIIDFKLAELLMNRKNA